MGFRRTLFTVAKILMTINIVVDRYDLATGTFKDFVNYQIKMRWRGKPGLKKDNRDHVFVIDD
jgi:hypothetical protein